jgi:hypothetical protein
MLKMENITGIPEPYQEHLQLLRYDRRRAPPVVVVAAAAASLLANASCPPSLASASLVLPRAPPERFLRHAGLPYSAAAARRLPSPPPSPLGRSVRRSDAGPFRRGAAGSRGGHEHYNTHNDYIVRSRMSLVGWRFGLVF